MAADPRHLRPSELCRLLNSTPLGEVISSKQLHVHRNRAGLRIGTGQHVDLLRYVAWLVHVRHAPKVTPDAPTDTIIDLNEAARGAAALGSRSPQLEREGHKLSHKQEALIAALLTEPSHAAAGAKAGVGRSTIYRWMHQVAFRSAYRLARREVVESAMGRVQTASGQAVETLLSVARAGRRDSDRVRAAVALLDHACRGLVSDDSLHGPQAEQEASGVDTNDVVTILGNRLRQLDQSELPTLEKSRVTATLADALLRAIGVDVLDKRLEALQAVLVNRKNADS